MANLNKVFLIGNLTRDPELRATPRGTAICQFGLAVNREWRTEGGEKQSEVTFIDIEAWGKQGETVAKFCTKGRPLFVEGRLKFDQWEDKTSGQKRSKLKVVMEGFQFLGGREDGEQRPAATRDDPPPAPVAAARSNSNSDEDVPF